MNGHEIADPLRGRVIVGIHALIRARPDVLRYGKAGRSLDLDSVAANRSQCLRDV